MFLGAYRFEGHPAELLSAYDRLMSGLPTDGLSLHACVADATGITIFDACPTREVFTGFSTSPALASAMAAAGLPSPAVAELGEVHLARLYEKVVTPA